MLKNATETYLQVSVSMFNNLIIIIQTIIDGDDDDDGLA